MFGSFVKSVKKVSKIRQKSWFIGNGSALRAVTFTEQSKLQFRAKIGRGCTAHDTSPMSICTRFRKQVVEKRSKTGNIC